ncbi:MAG: hypothetical protein FWD41_02385 [Actinomycetia bacterium]|nr:hypothetical protein [Actinomycetes bacterium]
MKRTAAVMSMLSAFMLWATSAFASTASLLPATGDELDIGPWVWAALGLGLAALLGALAYWWLNRSKAVVDDVALDDVETTTTDEVIEEVVVDDGADDDDFFNIELT